MCDFSTGRNTCCMKEPARTEGTCPMCFDSPVPPAHYGDSCGLGNCIGQPPFAPCGSATCAFADLSGPVCDERICPYNPAPLIDCKRPDGTRCNAYGAPTCLTEEPTKANFLDKFRYKDFSKLTFDKSKYVPSSYLPGDGADFMYGYNTKSYPEETGAGRCGSPCCEASSLDYVLQKLTAPINPIPTYTGTSNFNTNYNAGFHFPRKVSRSSKAPTSNACGAVDDRFGSKQTPASIESMNSSGTYCGTTSCSYPQPGGCGAPDCKFNKQAKKGCGAPDCKYAQKSDQSICPYANDEPNSKKKKYKGKGDMNSFGSCDSGVCPFAGMVQSEESSGVSCENPECPFAKRSDEECNDKSCPYAKELAICQDCGGVIVEGVDVEPVTQMSANQPQKPEIANATFASPALTTSIEVEKVIKQHKDPANKDNLIEAKASSSSTQLEQKRKKKKSDVLYQYPGIILGHHDCMRKKKNIPANMGWLWNIKPSVGNPELWRGYKPGAICKTVHKMIRKHRRALGIYDPSDLMRKKKSKTSTRALSDRNKRVISVRKKAGNYTVTLTPIKDPLMRNEHESPFLDCTPVHFRIVKSEIPKKPITLDENGCECEQDGKSDVSSDMSELDFNFSPPAALPVKAPRRKKNKISKDTQYNVQDLKPQKKVVVKPGTPKGSRDKKKRKKRS